jgi:uncharacterized protein with von Willebrand factor type A (vWA) domain
MSKQRLGGIIHTYQRYDPKNFPSPTQPPPDLVSGAMEHMLTYGSMRELTDEELARAVHLDPSQIAGLGPSLEALMELLRERKRKILETYETKRVKKEAASRFHDMAKSMQPPAKLEQRFRQAVKEEQLYDIERLWYRVDDERSPFARQLVQLIDRLGDKYQVDELAAKYEFTGRTPMTVPKAIEIKQELEEIDRLLKQLEEAAKTAQVGVIDMEALAEYAEPGDMEKLNDLARMVEQFLKDLAEQQGLEKTAQGYRLTPKAYRLFQGRLLERIFSNLEASRSGRHQGPILGEGAVELQQTKPYEFGDSLANMDIPGSLINAMLRDPPGARPRPGVPGAPSVRLRSEDIIVHRTRNSPKCATAVLLDMSGSMRYDGLYINVKRMGLALDGLIRREYPGDWLRFIEVYTFAKLRQAGEVVTLMPKPVTLFDPVVRLKADMSDERVSEMQIPPHFTNIQHGLQIARQLLAAQDTPNRQIILITDGLPTAHFEGKDLYLLYPPDSRTEEATLREGQLCRREGITINTFLLQSWWQSSEDVQFAQKLSESTKGRVFFTAGKDLDRYVVWDYVKRRREILS